MYTREEKALIWLSKFISIAPYKKIELLNNFTNAEEFFDNFLNEKDLIVGILSEKIYQNMLVEYNEDSLNDYILELERKSIRVLTLNSNNYPRQLIGFDDAPIVLYCRGDIELLNTECIAIIGTRKVSRYGRDVTKKFAAELSYQGYTIVSGLARGVDTIAHTETLANNGKTIAVLGCGIDIIYPSENRNLAIEILESGLIISEYPLGTKPLSFNFPQRNRIISGLSKGVLITEAGLRSGTTITANIALEQDVEVFAVPGSIFSEVSQGTNEMIKNEDNVIMTTCVNDILEKFGRKSIHNEVSTIQLDFIEQSIVNELESGELHFEDLLAKSKLEVSKLMSLLTGLEISGVIRKVSGNFYELINR